MAHRLVFLLVAGALLLPALARAQTVAGTLTVAESKDPNESPPTINADECNGEDPDKNPVTDNLTFHWTFTDSSFLTTDSVQIDVSNTTDCPNDNPNSGIHTHPAFVPAIPTPTTTTDQWPRPNTSTTVTAKQLIAAIPSGAGISCASSTNPTIFVCAHDTTHNILASGSIPLNTVAPGAPTGVIATPGENALTVTWTGPGGSPAATTFMARATSAEDPGNHDSSQVSGNSVRLGGLQTGVTYTVVVFAFSQFNNRSPPSVSTTGAPVPVTDFWEAYRDAGGGEQGGCGAGSAGAFSALLLPLALWRRRRS